MVLDGAMGTATKGFINFLGHFVIMNMYIVFREESAHQSHLWNEYDFIVVGGGSAGSVVASRLSEIPDFTVLLIEAGGDETLTTQIPWFHTLLPGSNLDWKFRTVPQDGILLGYDNQVSRWPRGRVIGGTSSINTMIYMRGNRKDYDQWASLGNDGWAYEDVLPYFKKSQHQTDPQLAADTVHHGTHGPLVVTTQHRRTPLMDAFLKAGHHLGYQIGDPNGFVQSDEHNRAYGVEFVHEGRVRNVRCRKEVIVSAGSVGSPKILMLSGIGPASHLHEIGITTRVDLPVGQNLQDHVGAFGLSWTTKKGSGYSLLPLTNPLTYKQYYTSHSGLLSETVGVEGNAYLHSRYINSSIDWPDIQIFFVSATPAIDGGQTFTEYLGISEEAWDSYFKPLRYHDGFSLVPVLLRPFSKGYIHLQSANPMEKPIIQPNYLKDPRDLNTLLDGLKMAIEIGNSPPFKRFNAKLHLGRLPRCPHLSPATDEYWLCWIRHFANTEHHIAGSCKMGSSKDPTAVVDPQLRVQGVAGLRVVDGSIMPQVVSGNTNVPIIMIGEKASDIIKKTWVEYSVNHYSNHF